MGNLKLNITGRELYEYIQSTLGVATNSIRIVIGMKEIYPDTRLARMDDQEVCKIMLKARVLGGARNTLQKEYRRKDTKL